MVVFGILIEVAARGANFLLGLYIWLVIGSAVISWVNADPYNPIVRFLGRATEPVLAPVRERMRGLTQRTGLDFSPIVVILAVVFIQRLIAQVILPFALRLQ